MKIFFDESRNTGEIGTNNSKLNFGDQRYFVLVGYIDNDYITNKYVKFKEKYIDRIYKKKEPNEIKGNDLLTLENNDILDVFINDFILKAKLLITVYDKKFYLVSSMLMWLFGYLLRDMIPVKFYNFCEFLIKSNDDLFVKYIDAINSKDKAKVKNFIKYLIEYKYNECITIEFEKMIKREFVIALQSFLEKDDEFIDVLMNDPILESIKIKGKYRNTIVNLSALGETLMLLKMNYKLKNADLEIYHDQIELIEDYIKHYMKDIKVDFIDSKRSDSIQLADNVASIIGKFINNILPVKSDVSVKEALSINKIWIRSRLTKILNSKNSKNIKIVTQLREQAFIDSYCTTQINNIDDFKKNIYVNLNKRFEIEMHNHLTTKESYEFFKKRSLRNGE